MAVALLLCVAPEAADPQRVDLSGEAAPQSASTRQLLPVEGAAKPAFTLPDLDGAPQSLDAHAGRVVLVHFFATWCEPCREELAALSRLSESPLGRHVTVVAVDVAEVAARVRRFLQTAPVKFPVLLDADRAVARAWGVDVLPTTFVLDAGQQPRLVVEGDLDWIRPDVLAALEAVASGAPGQPRD